MSHLRVLSPALFRHRVALLCMHPGRRLRHWESRNPIVSPSETIVGLAVFFATFLTPFAYGMTHLNDFRRG